MWPLCLGDLVGCHHSLREPVKNYLAEGGTPPNPTPLAENHFAKKPLAERGGTPHLNRKSPKIFLKNGAKSAKKIMIFARNMRFLGGKLNGWSDKVEIFVTNRSKYMHKKWPK